MSTREGTLASSETNSSENGGKPDDDPLCPVLLIFKFVDALVGQVTHCEYVYLCEESRGERAPTGRMMIYTENEETLQISVQRRNKISETFAEISRASKIANDSLADHILAD